MNLDTELDEFRYSSWINSKLVAMNLQEMRWQFLIHGGGLKGIYAEACFLGMRPMKIFEISRHVFEKIY